MYLMHKLLWNGKGTGHLSSSTPLGEVIRWRKYNHQSEIQNRGLVKFISALCIHYLS